MRTIYKYEVPVNDRTTVAMPEGAFILHFGDQRGVLCVWAIVDPDAQREDREFVIVGTGHPMPEKVGPHLATVQQGPFVWHIFEPAP